MVTYKLLTKIQDCDDFAWMLKKGIIPVKVLDYKCYFEKWLQYTERGNSNAQAYTYTADDFGVSENTIRNAVNMMKS